MNHYRIFDGHCDTAVELWLKNQSLVENTLAVSLNRAKKFGGYAQFFAFCTAWIANRLAHTEQFSQALTYFMQQLRKNEASVTLCCTAAQAEAAMQQGKTAAFLAIEGAEAVRCDPGLLDEAYEQGVRMISLVWNLPNDLTGSCVSGEGLTAKGKDFFRRAQKLGMLVDVSHLSERGFWDMAELAEKPIVASHSNSRAVCAHPRNLTDEQFRAICQLGGTAGLTLCAPFLRQDGAADFDDIRRHLDHFLSLGGQGHIALGADLDGTDTLPEGFCALDDYNALGAYLTQTGYAGSVIQDLFCDSLMKVVKTCIT